MQCASVRPFFDKCVWSPAARRVAPFAFRSHSHRSPAGCACCRDKILSAEDMHATQPLGWVLGSCACTLRWWRLRVHAVRQPDSWAWPKPSCRPLLATGGAAALLAPGFGCCLVRPCHPLSQDSIASYRTSSCHRKDVNDVPLAHSRMATADTNEPLGDGPALAVHMYCLRTAHVLLMYCARQGAVGA